MIKIPAGLFKACHCSYVSILRNNSNTYHLRYYSFLILLVLQTHIQNTNTQQEKSRQMKV